MSFEASSAVPTGHTVRNVKLTDWPRDQDWIWHGPLHAPSSWGKPGVVMTFNLECAGCISRGIPFLKRLASDHGERLQVALLHTAHGHRRLPRDQVEPQLLRFAGSFARLDLPIALDLDGDLAEAWGAEGTPHWFVFDAAGRLVRSLYGSQDGARTRLSYLTQELLDEAA